jgi:CRP-like cAMP-binding protein
MNVTLVTIATLSTFWAILLVLAFPPCPAVKHSTVNTESAWALCRRILLQGEFGFLGNTVMSSSTEVSHGFSRLCFSGRLELLQGVNQEAVHRFNAMVRKTKRRRGEWVFVHGDRADSIYFLQTGRLKITALSEDGHEVVHEILGPGEIFGDTSMILHIPRTTSAQALEASVLCEIRQKDFESLLVAYPELSLQLLKSVGLRLKKAEAQLLNLICHDVSTRVREALIALMIKESGTRLDQPIELRITQQDLANSIGASRQKTWRALKELEDSSVLRLMYRSILVIEPRKLRNEDAASQYGVERFLAKAKATGL